MKVNNLRISDFELHPRSKHACNNKKKNSFAYN